MAKESKYGVLPQPIWRETFADEQSVRSNGGVPTAITYLNGTAIFNGVNSYIQYGQLYFNGVYSIRIKLRPLSFVLDNMLFDSRGLSNNGAGYIYLSITTGVVNSSSGFIYLNGSLSNNPTINKDYDLVVSGITLKTGTGGRQNLVGANTNLLVNFLGSMELLEIYQGTLTAQEVANLYNNSRNKSLSPYRSGITEILNIDGRRGAISNKYSGISLPQISNGDNEVSLFSPISSTSKGTTTRSSDVAYTGTYSAKYLCNTATSGPHYISILSVPAGCAVIVSAWLYIPSGSFSACRFYDLNDGSWLSTAISTKDTWVQISETRAAKATSWLLAVGNENSESKDGQVFYVDNISISVVIPSITNTAVTSVRSGRINAMSFNGSTSKLDCGSYDTLVGDKTFIAWIKPSALVNGRIISNGKLYFMTVGGTLLRVYSDGVNSASSAASLNLIGRWTLFVATRTSVGITNIYVNGILSGTGDQSSGTPTASGITNIFIGSQVNGTNEYNGRLSNIRILNGILTAQEISNLYTSEKGMYFL